VSQNEMHRFDIFLSPTPIAPDFEIAEDEGLRPSFHGDVGCGANGFLGDRAGRPKRRFMIEEYA
jgi:hypothetical protein